MADEKPSFFKALSDKDFTKLLRLPPGFITRYELTLPELVKLRARPSGRAWRVRVERLHGLFCFTEGWQSFARDAALQLGEFLVFTQITTSKFDVVIYEKSFCERKIPPSPYHPLIANNTKNQGRNDVGSSREDPLYFELCLKRHHGSRLSLPARFSIASGMKGRKHVVLEYLPSHDRKRAVVDHRVQSSLNRFELTAGWKEFRVANGLALETTTIYSFEFNPNLNLIQVNKLRN